MGKLGSASLKCAATSYPLNRPFKPTSVISALSFFSQPRNSVSASSPDEYLGFKIALNQGFLDDALEVVFFHSSGSTPSNPSSARPRSSEDVDDANWNIRVDPVLHAIRKQRTRPRSAPSMKRFFRDPPQIVRESYRASDIKHSVFTLCH